jgi:sugar phosphate isomerase/epimerase
LRGNPDPAESRGIRVSVSTGSFYAFPLGAALRLIRRAGASRVELVAGPHAWVHRPSGLLRMAAAEGIAIESLHPPIVDFPGWRDVPTVVPRMARLAQELGVRLLVLHPPDSGPHDAELTLRYERALEQAHKELAAAGVTLALENLAADRPRDAGLVFCDPAKLLDLATRHDLPVVFDTCHADSCPLGLDGTTRLLRDRVAHVHLGDVTTPPRFLNRPALYTFVKQHQMPGTGRLPLQQWLTELVRRSYTGTVVLEISPSALAAWWPPEARRRLGASVRWTEAALKGAIASGLRAMVRCRDAPTKEKASLCAPDRRARAVECDGLPSRRSDEGEGKPSHSK